MGLSGDQVRGLFEFPQHGKSLMDILGAELRRPARGGTARRMRRGPGTLRRSRRYKKTSKKRGRASRRRRGGARPPTVSAPMALATVSANIR